MLNKTTYCILALLVLAAACKTSNKATGGQPAYIETIVDDAFRKPILDKALYIATSEIVPLDTAFIAKDTLHIITKKIQGCDAETFKLMWNGAMAKSLPPQTSVKLLQAVDPACKERHKFHLTYNITPLRFKQDSSASKSTLVRIGGWKEMVKYEFVK
jgi:hypothetical protein